MRIIVADGVDSGLQSGSKIYQAHFGELAEKIPAIFATVGLKNVEILSRESSLLDRAVFIKVTLPKVLEVTTMNARPKSTLQTPESIYFEDDYTAILGFGYRIHWLRKPKPGTKLLELLIILRVDYLSEPNITKDHGQKLLEQLARCITRPWIRLQP